MILRLLAAIAALSVAGGALPAVAAAQAGTADQEPRRILVLYDENKDDLPGLERTDRSLREAFRAGLAKVEIYSESMGLSQSHRSGYESELAEFYRIKYAGRRPDLIIAVMEPALNFLLRHADRLFPDVPIVFAGIDASTFSGKKLPSNVTGVLLKRAYSPTLDVALRLQPDTREVFVVGGGASPFDELLQSLIRRDLRSFEGRVQITYLFGMTMDALLTRLSRLPQHSVILYLSMLTDGSGRRFVPAEALSSIVASANAPVYVFLEQYVGLGAVGGNVYSFQTQGTQVAALGLQILRGVSPASLPVREQDAQVNLFDARELRRWNLNEARLPLGSVIRNRESSVWVQYRWYIIAAMVVLLTQSALIGGLLLLRHRQVQVEAEARRQRDDLAHVLRVATLGEMTASLVHEISQPVGAIRMNARVASALMEGTRRPEEVGNLAEALADISAAAGHASYVIDRLRTLFRRERAEYRQLDVKALIGEAVRLLRTAMLIGGIDIRLAFDEAMPAILGDPVQLEQVLLNVLLNARDAIAASSDGPRVIMVRAGQDSSRNVIVEVADTGDGVAEADLERIFEHFVSTKPKGLGMGLAISRSIIEAHGGRIWATRNSERGLTVHIKLPSDIRRDVRTAVEMDNVAGAT
ncbi:MAG TPA: ATP-binding protein [Gemmatimonadales bacterium]